MMLRVRGRPRKTDSGTAYIIELEGDLGMLSQAFNGPTCHIGRSISD